MSEGRLQGDSPAGCKTKAVRWVPARKRYVLTYTDSDGNIRTYSQGLAPQEEHEDGSALTQSQYMAELRRVHIKARKLWNEYDKSEKPRLPE